VHAEKDCVRLADKTYLHALVEVVVAHLAAIEGLSGSGHFGAVDGGWLGHGEGGRGEENDGGELHG